MAAATLLLLVFLLAGLPVMAMNLLITAGHILDDREARAEWKRMQQRQEKTRLGM